MKIYIWENKGGTWSGRIGNNWCHGDSKREIIKLLKEMSKEFKLKVEEWEQIITL